MHWSSDWSSWWWMPFGMVIAMLIVVVAVVIAIRALVRAPSDPSAGAVLDGRYARGEIDDEEYRRRRSALRDFGDR